MANDHQDRDNAQSVGQDREAARLRAAALSRQRRERIESDPATHAAIGILHHALAFSVDHIAEMFRCPACVVESKLDAYEREGLSALFELPIGVAAVAIRNRAAIAA